MTIEEGTIAYKLQYVYDTKTGIKNAILAKGGEIDDNTTFREYANVISNLPSGGGSGYTRPSDWLPMPTVTEDEQKVSLLIPIIKYNEFNYVAFSIGGDYTVDWGDGTTTNYTSGSIATHNYLYDNIDINTLCSRGYKQVIINITPQSGSNLTFLNFTSDTSIATKTNALEISIKGSNILSNSIESIYFQSSVYTEIVSILSKLKYGINFQVGLAKLKKITFADTSNGSSITSMFSGCANLLEILGLNTINFTYAESMFYNCTNLTIIPELNTSNAISMYQMFRQCSNLLETPELDCSSAITMGQMFYGCYNLQKVNLINTSGVTYMNQMFTNCTSMFSMPEIDTSSVTNMSSMFMSCTNLRGIPELDTSNVTSMYGMFFACSNLTTIPEMNTYKVTDMGSMFRNCTHLTAIPELNLTSATDLSNFVTGCSNLETFSAINIKVSLSLANCKLARIALLEVFSNLVIPASGSPTLTITGNPGVADLTIEDKAIVTNKGWTLVL